MPMKLVGFLVLAFAAFGQTDVRRALAIGVSDYPNYPKDNPIHYAHSDASRFAELLAGDRAGRFNVTTLLNGNATRKAILDALITFRNDGVRTDTLFVFFSGHGVIDPITQQLYLMPNDGEPRSLAATGILGSQFLDEIKAVGANRVVVFLDACSSARSSRHY